MVKTTPPQERRRALTGGMTDRMYWVKTSHWNSWRRTSQGMLGICKPGCRDGETPWLMVRKAVLRSIAGSFPAVALFGGNLGGMLPITGANAATIPRE